MSFPSHLIQVSSNLEVIDGDERMEQKSQKVKNNFA